MSAGRRILIVNVNWMGDVLFSTPALRALRKAFPGDVLACALPPRCAPLVANNPNLDEVIALDDETSLARSAFASLAAAARLRGRYDAAIFFHRSRTKLWIARLAGVRERVGFEAPGRGRLLTRPVPPSPPGTHRIDRFLALAAAFGAPSDGRRTEFYPRAGAQEELDRTLADAGFGPGEPYVAVHPGGNWELKRWPPGHFARWIRLYHRRTGVRAAVIGTAPERALAERVVAEAGEGAVSLCGRTSVDALALLLRRARFLLSNDSGPIHLAATQGARIMTLFGPTSPGETGPVSDGGVTALRKDVGCEVPCYFRSCDHRVCLELLSPEEVLEKTVEAARAAV